MSVLDFIVQKSVWEKFLTYKLEKSLLTKREQVVIKKYIEEERYLPISEKIIRGDYHFSPPMKYFINKVDKQKKRVVYQYQEDETMVLKLISFLCYRYDDKIPSNCYSFRKSQGVKQAIYALIKNKEIKTMCCYKVDIENYFNSIPIKKLLPKLEHILKDEKLYVFLKEILEDKRVSFQGKIIEEEKGIMAGVPISAFLANVYLMDLDKSYEEEKKIYARYSDDIILFCKEGELEEEKEKLKRQIEEYGLKINLKKEESILPYQQWSFLGFAYEDGKIDLSDISKKKIKGKIRRAARKIRRWMLKKGASFEKALKVMNRKFNDKFYAKESGRELSWARWFFPIINEIEGLREVDHYMQDYLRYIVTGKHNKKNYEKVPYSILKQCNYQPLVAAYYKMKENDYDSV